jgi:hypothetical protein
MRWPGVNAAWRAGWAWIGATALWLAPLAAAAGFGFWLGGWLGAGLGAAAWALAFLSPLAGVEGSWAGRFYDLLSFLFRGRGDAARDDVVRRALAELVQPGRLLFNPPDRMRLGQMERVEVRLTRALDLDAALLGRLGGNSEPRLEEVATASRMAVTLAGDGFDIVCHSEEEQAVTQDGVTAWEFDIRAVRRGRQRLLMSVSLRFPVPGQPVVCKSIPVREVTIDVEVGVPALVGQFVSCYWQWLLTTAIAIAAVVVVFFH